MTEVIFTPIGAVRNDVKEPKGGGWGDVASEIIIDPAFENSLDNLEDFSHIVVVFWMHRATAVKPPAAKVHPQGRADMPLVGLFATRSPNRPNPVGVSVARLVGREGNVLRVVGLDAIDGTPVLDIKPYLPPRDSPADFRVPEWVKRADDRHHRKDPP